MAASLYAASPPLLVGKVATARETSRALIDNRTVSSSFVLNTMPQGRGTPPPLPFQTWPVRRAFARAA